MDTRGEGVGEGEGVGGCGGRLDCGVQRFLMGDQGHKSTACQVCLAPTVSTIKQSTKSTMHTRCREANTPFRPFSALRLYLGIIVCLVGCRALERLAWPSGTQQLL